MTKQSLFCFFVFFLEQAVLTISLNLQGAVRKRENRNKKGKEKHESAFYLYYLSGGCEWMWRENISSAL